MKENKKTTSSRPNNLVIWFGALFLGILISASPFIKAHHLSYFYYYLNWKYWPDWYAANLWLIAISSLITCIFRNLRIKSWFCVVTVTAITTITVLNSIWLSAFIRSTITMTVSIYSNYFIPYLHVPITDYMATSKILWVFFIISALTALTSIILFSCRLRFKKHRLNVKIDSKVRNKEGNYQ